MSDLTALLFIGVIVGSLAVIYIVLRIVDDVLMWVVRRMMPPAVRARFDAAALRRRWEKYYPSGDFSFARYLEIVGPTMGEGDRYIREMIKIIQREASRQ